MPRNVDTVVIINTVRKEIETNLLTRGRRKSHTRSGYKKGATNAPLAPSMWMPISQPVFSFNFTRASLSSCMINICPLCHYSLSFLLAYLDRFKMTREGWTQNSDYSDGIFIHKLYSLFYTEYVVGLLWNWHLFHFDIKVACEFFEAHLRTRFKFLQNGKGLLNILVH